MEPPVAVDKAPLDVDECAREPIHLPGSIQPHGVLLGLDEELTIVVASANVRAVLGRDSAALVGAPLSDLLVPDEAECLSEARNSEAWAVNPLPINVDIGGEQSRFDGIISRAGDLTLLELEPVPWRNSRVPVATHNLLRRAVLRLHGANSVDELAQVVADEARSITGFDRVMLYRFDAEWNGEVVAEAKADDVDSFLGLHFPAGDIPPQARALYERNWLRIIPDVAYEAAPLLGAPGFTPESLDLSDSALRSVSPVHLEYLKNMGVRSSMSVSIMSEGRLWGLIACHHQSEPHFLPYGTRTATELLGQVASTLIAAKDDRDRYEKALTVRSAQTRLLDNLAREQGNVAVALTFLRPTIADLVAADGAILCLAGERYRVGAVPSDAEVDALATTVWAAGLEAFDTDRLSTHYPAFEPIRHLASGVIAVPLSPTLESWVMWFRAEEAQTITWAGEPTKVEVRNADGGPRIGPRRSFGEWKQELRGRAVPWTEHERRAALDVARRVTATLSGGERSDSDAVEAFREGFRDDDLPDVPGITFKGKHRVGGGSFAGGDWYDAVLLPDGRTAFAIGDVAGHGVVAAAAMSQLRTGLRAYLLEESQPSGALTRLNRLVSWLMPSDLATGICAFLDPATRELTLSSAGHLPPLLIRDGEGVLVQTPRAPALGISELARYGDVTVQLNSGDTVVLYTDGLVESRSEPIDVGFARICEVAARIDGGLDTVLDALIAHSHSTGIDDDVAVFGMRLA